MSFQNLRLGNLNKISWSSPDPVTLSDIERMRKEFWETAYAYEGYKETWDVLKLCIEHVHNNKLEQAQELLLYQGITLPNGNLTECYNELGYKFEIPNYVLSLPTNLKTEEEKLDNELPKGNLENYSSLRVNLSDSRQFELDVGFNDTVERMKAKLERLSNVSVANQRWYFDGKALRNEVAIRKYQISPSFIVQVIVHKPKIPT